MFETFARNPEEYDRVRQDPGLDPMAIEEHLRFTSPIQNLYRYTRADYDIDVVTIPRGSRVLLSFGAANRDPEAFEEHDNVRADRTHRMKENEREGSGARVVEYEKDKGVDGSK